MYVILNNCSNQFSIAYHHYHPSRNSKYCCVFKKRDGIIEAFAYLLIRQRARNRLVRVSDNTVHNMHTETHSIMLMSCVERRESAGKRWDCASIHGRLSTYTGFSGCPQCMRHSLEQQARASNSWWDGWLVHSSRTPVRRTLSFPPADRKRIVPDIAVTLPCHQLWTSCERRPRTNRVLHRSECVALATDYHGTRFCYYTTFYNNWQHQLNHLLF